MYCSGCGQSLPAGQQFCPSCGRAVVQPAPTAAPVFYTRVHRHLQALSILWIAYGVWTILGWLLTMAIFAHIFGGQFNHWNYGPWSNGPWSSGPWAHGFFAHMPWFVPLISVILIGRAILSFATGFSLLARAPWARILALITAFLTIIRPITGTALAIYTLWALLPRASGQEYEQIAAARANRIAI